MPGALPPVIFLLGPTASGKTALAMELVDRFPLEIVSVDSALVYREMNIGTAKPDAATLEKYPHYLVDLIDPTDAYSAARYCNDALAAIGLIHSRGKVPLLVGGTMLYAKALLEGLSDLPEADAAVRAELEAEAAQIGWPAMHARLGEVDAVSAARLKPNDSQRVQRALEVFRLTGLPMSALQSRAGKHTAFPFPSLRLGLVPSDRAALHGRIAQRFDAMLSGGLVDEVNRLRERFTLNADMPSMRCVGYRQAWQFIEGEIDLATLRESGIAATRQLAKRQMTWLRSMPEIDTADCLSADLAAQVGNRCERFLAEPATVG